MRTFKSLMESLQKDSKDTHNWYDMSTVGEKHFGKYDDTDQSTFMTNDCAPDGDSACKRPDTHVGVHKSNKTVNAALKRYGATKVS